MIKRFKTGKIVKTRSTKTAQNEILTLANGFKVVFYQVPTIDMVSVLLRVHTGSNFEGKYLGSGISHFLEHGMFLGSKNQPGKDSFSNHIARYGGNDLNAFTSENYTCYQFSVFTRYLEKALDLFFDFINHPRFPKQAVKEEQGTIISEMDIYDDKPSDWFYRMIFSRIFANNPNELPIIGLREKFHRLNHLSLRDYHRTHYRPDNMHLILVGKFNAEKIQKVLMRLQGTKTNFVTRGETPFIPGGKNIQWRNSNWGHEATNSINKRTRKSTTSTVTGFTNPPFRFSETSHPRAQFIKVSICYEGLDFQDPHNITLDVLSHILASGRGSILHELLKEKYGLVERISANLLQIHPHETSKFFIEFTLPEKINTFSLDKIRECITKICNRITGVLEYLERHLTPVFLAGSKNTFLKSFVDEKDDFIDIANSLSYSLANYGHLHYEEEYFAWVKKLKRPAILSIVKEYLVKRAPHLFILIPPQVKKSTPLFNNINPEVETQSIPSEMLRFEEMVTIEKHLAKNLLHYRSEKVSAVNPTVPPTPKLMCTQYIPPTRSTTLANGSRFLAKRVSGLPKVCLQLVFKGGSILEQSIEHSSTPSSSLTKREHILNRNGKKPKYLSGSFNLLSKLFFSSNARYSKAAIAEGLRKHGITYSSFCGENSFGLSFSMLSSKLYSLYPFLRAILLSPVYTRKDFKKEQQEIIYTIKKSKEDSFYLALQKFKLYFFNQSAFANDPRGELASIPLLKPALIKDIHHTHLNANNLVVHLTGDYTVKQQDDVKNIFEQIASGTPRPEHFNKIITLGKNLPPLNYTGNVVYDFDSGEQSHFFMGYRVPRVGEKNFGIFKLIHHYLEGLGGPLFKLRSEDFVKNGKSLGGRCYRLGCFLRNSVGYGMLVFYASFRKEASHEHEWAVTAFQKELQKLRTKLIDPEQLERAKNTLLSNMMQESIKHAEISFNEALLETYGLGHGYGAKEIAALQKVPAEEVRNAVNTYLRKDNFFAYGMKPQK